MERYDVDYVYRFMLSLNGLHTYLCIGVVQEDHLSVLVQLKLYERD